MKLFYLVMFVVVPAIPYFVSLILEKMYPGQFVEDVNY